MWFLWWMLLSAQLCMATTSHCTCCATNVLVLLANAHITECTKTKECRHAKIEYDECTARVTAAADSEHKGPHEDCVEECTYCPRSSHDFKVPLKLRSISL
jgi:hypothetical protein